MREQIQARLNELKRQFEVGQTELKQLQARENYLRETMLQISGAMLVLEELLADGKPDGRNGTDPHKTELIVAQANEANA